MTITTQLGPLFCSTIEPAIDGGMDWLAHTQDIAYLIAAILFIFGLKQLSSPRTARRGNALAAVGMLIAIGATLTIQNVLSVYWILGGAVVGSGIGAVLAIRIQMTAMPQLVAMFNGFGGLASTFVVGSEYVRRTGVGHASGQTIVAGHAITFDQGLTMGLSILVGCVTFTGSMVAYGKLQGVIAGRPRKWTGQLIGNAVLLIVAIGLSLIVGFDRGAWWTLPIIAILASVLGVTLTMAIGGADMPVMVALLNSYSGIAACATGFILTPPNKALIVSGALVGASGILLTTIMCKAMNRPLSNVLFGGVGSDESTGTAQGAEDRLVRSVDADELAMLLDGVRKVIIVPGYGMAVAQAQHAVRDLYNLLTARDVEVYFGIHPVAGRMPGHMNVLLAEVDIPYEHLLDLDQCNPEFESTELAIVIGANDVVNPSARHDKSSPIYGMPILDVDKAQTVVVCKRSMGAGYSGVQNELFYGDNTLMFFGDAKKSMTDLVHALKEA